jgi:hypothetical protein
VNTERHVEPYEQSRQRNDDHNVSASASLVRPNCDVRNDGMARTHGNATKEVKRRLLTAEGWVDFRSLDLFMDHP